MSFINQVKKQKVMKHFLALAMSGCIITANAQDAETLTSHTKGDYFGGLTRPLTFDRMISPHALEVTFSKTVCAHKGE